MEVVVALEGQEGGEAVGVAEEWEEAVAVLPMAADGRGGRGRAHRERGRQLHADARVQRLDRGALRRWRRARVRALKLRVSRVDDLGGQARRARRGRRRRLVLALLALVGRGAGLGALAQDDELAHAVRHLDGVGVGVSVTVGRQGQMRQGCVTPYIVRSP